VARSCPQAIQCVYPGSLAAPHTGQNGVEFIMIVLLQEKDVQLLDSSAVERKRR
jgi:hypothetical protein